MLKKQLADVLHEIMKVNQRIVDTVEYQNLISLCEQDIGILHLVSEHEGISAKEISSLRGVPKTTIVSAVDRLVKRGYLQKEVDRKDKRRHCLTLTKLGERANYEHEDYEEKILNYLINQWSEEDRKILADLLARRRR